MVSWLTFSQLLGGLGLFLLGMWLLTEGLKLAGGHALQEILANWTVTKFYSFLSGFTLTAIVQSSSAVTVSVIGFINAGLLDLSRSLWIIFGSNVGTTMTAWIVALIGFKFKIDAFALPAIGIGALLHLFSSNIRNKSLGGALAGLGLLFLGLQTLQGAFINVEQLVDFSTIFMPGFSGMLMLLLIGFGLTAIMQSSSAAMAIVLTAVSTDVLPLAAGAAAVIGSNVGTTVTAIIAVLKATANARRVAVAHVIFNLTTALVALILLGFFLSLIQWLQEAMQLDPNPAVSLALFHTIFNLLGVALMIPLEPKISQFLLRLFTRSEVQIIKPQFLDKNIISIPDLALNAAVLDQKRLFSKLKPLVLELQRDQEVSGERIRNLHGLIFAINEYVVQCSQQQIPIDTANAFQTIIHTNLHLSNCLDNLQDARPLIVLKQKLTAAQQEKVNQLQRQAIEIVLSCDIDVEPESKAPVEQLLELFEHYFTELRQFTVDEVRRQHISTITMEDLLKHLAALRRMVRQLVKAYLALSKPLQLSYSGENVE